MFGSTKHLNHNVRLLIHKNVETQDVNISPSTTINVSTFDSHLYIKCTSLSLFSLPLSLFPSLFPLSLSLSLSFSLSLASQDPLIQTYSMQDGKSAVVHATCLHFSEHRSKRKLSGISLSTRVARMELKRSDYLKDNTLSHFKVKITLSGCSGWAEYSSLLCSVSLSLSLSLSPYIYIYIYIYVLVVYIQIQSHGVKLGNSIYTFLNGNIYIYI